MPPENAVWLQLGLMAIGIAIGIANLIVVICSLRTVMKQLRLNHQWKQFERSHDVVRELNLGKILEIRLKLEQRVKIYDPAQTYGTLNPPLSPEEEHHLDAMLNFFESICFAISNQSLDERIIRETLENVLLCYWRWATPYVVRSRALVGPRLWFYIDPYVAKWEKHHRDELEAAKRQEATELANRPNGAPKIRI